MENIGHIVSRIFEILILVYFAYSLLLAASCRVRLARGQHTRFFLPAFANIGSELIVTAIIFAVCFALNWMTLATFFVGYLTIYYGMFRWDVREGRWAPMTIKEIRMEMRRMARR